MMNIPNKQIKRRGLSLLLSIILVFCMFGAIIFSVSRKTAREMSNSAIQNLSESLDLIESTIETILRSEAEFQTLIAQEIARVDDPEAYIRAYEKNQTMSKMSLILSGKPKASPIPESASPKTAWIFPPVKRLWTCRSPSLI